MIYYNLPQLIVMIDSPNRERCLKLLEAEPELFATSRGSKCKHQWWEGGYSDHITEIMNIAVVTYKALNRCRPLPFSLSDALLTLYLHDLEKLWVYAKDKAVRITLSSDDERHEFVNDVVAAYGFELTPEHKNALKYVHGEGDDYHPSLKIQGPLGAFIHHCDNTSARIWFDCPLKEDDPWRDSKIG